MSKIDLDAARAARREAKADPPEASFGGVTFAFPIEIPYTAIEGLNRLEEATGTQTLEILNDVIKKLLGERYAEFEALGPSMEDITELFKGLMAAYGFADAGNASASSAPSKTTGSRPRRTSKPPTK